MLILFMIKSGRYKNSSYLCYFKGEYNGTTKRFVLPLIKMCCRDVNKTNRQQCKRQTVFGYGICYQHLRSHHSLVISPSLITTLGNDSDVSIGRGLFACNDSDVPRVVFKRGDMLCPYEGETLTDPEFNDRYGSSNAPYCIAGEQRNRNGETTKTFDSTDALRYRSVGSMANNKDSKETNACLRTIVESDGSHRYFIVAKKDILSGEEIYLYYGEDFVFNGDRNSRCETLRSHLKPPSWFYED